MRIIARIAKGANAENVCIATTCADLARMAQSDCGARFGLGFAIAPLIPRTSIRSKT
jgi:hypothetical protein